MDKRQAEIERLQGLQAFFNEGKAERVSDMQIGGLVSFSTGREEAPVLDDPDDTASPALYSGAVAGQPEYAGEAVRSLGLPYPCLCGCGQVCYTENYSSNACQVRAAQQRIVDREQAERAEAAAKQASQPLPPAASFLNDGMTMVESHDFDDMGLATGMQAKISDIGTHMVTVQSVSIYRDANHYQGYRVEKRYLAFSPQMVAALQAQMATLA